MCETCKNIFLCPRCSSKYKKENDATFKTHFWAPNKPKMENRDYFLFPQSDAEKGLNN